MVKTKKKKTTRRMSPEKKIESGFRELYERECKKNTCKPKFHHTCNSGALYFIGFIGALVYYIQTATGFWNGFWGILKALVWPAFLVYEALRYLGA